MVADDEQNDRLGETALPGADAGSGTRLGAPPENSVRVRVPLAEETLETRVVQKQVGSVLIHKHIETQSLHDEVELHRDEVGLEQLEVDELVDERREPWYEDGMLVIPVYEEVLVTEKRLMLTKLVRVQRKERIEQVSIDEDVRKEVLSFESKPATD